MLLKLNGTASVKRFGMLVVVAVLLVDGTMMHVGGV
jgi:hypothetical protein